MKYINTNLEQSERTPINQWSIRIANHSLSGKEDAAFFQQHGYVPYVPVEKPAYDASSEHVRRNGCDDEGKDIWEKIPMTPPEILSVQKAQSDAAEVAQIKAIYHDLRNGVGTAGERITRVEKVLARLLRDNYGE